MGRALAPVGTFPLLSGVRVARDGEGGAYSVGWARSEHANAEREAKAILPIDLHPRGARERRVTGAQLGADRRICCPTFACVMRPAWAVHAAICSASIALRAVWRSEVENFATARRVVLFVSFSSTGVSPAPVCVTG